jgi:hypothetical protein
LGTDITNPVNIPIIAAQLNCWVAACNSASVTIPAPIGGITNGGFETGDFSGWTTSGTTSITTVAHSGNYAALVGSPSPTVGDGSLVQTFTVPSESSFSRQD